MLPRDGYKLPRWRRHVMTWVMALVRLAAAWIVTQAPLTALALKPGFMRVAVTAPPRLGLAAVLAGGIVAFAWPRTCPYGFVLLLAGLTGFEALWISLGLPLGATALWSAAILTVLAAGEWLARRLQRELYPGD